ncbi:MAG: hypothetical protein KDJ76_02045 [Xanthobacteraceae bacterium]|nr:hypothetical protein [Xanthobacteraceae bacterium]
MRSITANRASNWTSNWRLSTFNGLLIALYFIPAWTLAALHIVVSPVRGVFERPNVAVAMFISDVLHTSPLATVRLAWLLALGKLTVVAFFIAFAVFALRAATRKSDSCDEALAIALGMASTISFGSMVFAAQVGERAALQLHATELLLLIGTAIVMLVQAPHAPARGDDAAPALFEQPQLLHHR